MEKQTLTTYTAYRASIHFCTHDAEITINDHSAGEILSIEGLDPVTLRAAITCYLHNLSLIKGDSMILPWFKALHKDLEGYIKAPTSSEQ